MAANAMCHRRARSLVTRYGFASGTGWLRRNRTQPTLGMSTRDHFRLACPARLACGPTIRKPSCWPAFRHVGRRCVPAKKLRRAWSRSRRACCCAVWLPAASHGSALRASVSWRHCSANPGVGPGPAGTCRAVPGRGSTRTGHARKALPARRPGQAQVPGGSGTREPYRQVLTFLPEGAAFPPRPERRGFHVAFPVMRSDALRPATAKASTAGQNKLAARLSPGEKHGR